MLWQKAIAVIEPLTFYKFLDASAKWRKATINFVMSVRPSNRMEQHDSHWTDFDNIRYLNFLSKICREISSFVRIRQE